MYMVGTLINKIGAYYYYAAYGQVNLEIPCMHDATPLYPIALVLFTMPRYFE